MRLWSLHPKYLDRQGLVALWREALLAQAVLRGRTRGYRHHPQLERFREQRDPVAAIGAYLSTVHDEAASRGYRFTKAKIVRPGKRVRMRVTAGQLRYELAHLRDKLQRRDQASHQSLRKLQNPRPHPLFRVTPGRVEAWEKQRTMDRS
ncbi:MAG TPA: pyrimidine dimer DNA glycosylase/endonuclease V [Candidatus Edwardsbacteria bacterium]|nr:pyrimidine dimer DNA glycosylase/endonuclease V [Candidatus Edwardsbacteria bacterium]